MRASDVQVGGQHYKDMAIQPTEYITKNKLGFIEGNIIKYISRWRFKNGVEDLKKIKHYVDLLIEYEGLEPKGEGTDSAYGRWKELEQKNLRGYFGIWE